MRKNEKLIKIVSYTVVIGYIFGMLFLVSFLKTQAKEGNIDTIIANVILDIYTFSIGICLMYLMPFSIHQRLDRVIFISYMIFALFLGLAVYIKYFIAGGQVIGDLLYVFSGAMLYQGIKCTIKFVKIRKIKMEDME